MYEQLLVGLFIAQLVEHRTHIAEVRVRIPFRPSALPLKLVMLNKKENARITHFKLNFSYLLHNYVTQLSLLQES